MAHFLHLQPANSVALSAAESNNIVLSSIESPSNGTLFCSALKITFFVATSFLLLKYSRQTWQKIYARSDAFKESWHKENPNLKFETRPQTAAESSIDRQNNIDQFKGIVAFAFACLSCYLAWNSWSQRGF